DHRHRRREHIGTVTTDDDVDFVDIEQLAVDARHRRRVALVVVVNKLHRPSEKTALGVGFLDPYFHREQRGFAVRPEWTGFRDAKTDLDRLLVLRRCRRHRAKRGERPDQASKCCRFQISKHGEPPERIMILKISSPIARPTPATWTA